MELVNVEDYSVVNNKKELQDTMQYVVKLSSKEIDVIISALGSYIDREEGIEPQNKISIADVLSESFEKIIEENE